VTYRSRLCALVIDCNDLRAATRFWTGALGVGLRDGDVERDTWVELEPPVSGMPPIYLQTVLEPKTSKSRVHLDFETDDVEAEARRLERLGGRRKSWHGDYWIMEDSSGNEFCVMSVMTEEFPDGARRWEQDESG
jgi:predicted enzyme related to lactoylglutathione lyase